MAIQMKCEGMNNKGYTQIYTHNGQWANPQAMDKSSILAALACRTRSRSWVEEELYPLLATEIR